MTQSLTRSRLVELLDRAERTRILVIGDAMLDVYLRGDVERISPEAPVPVVRVRERSFALGGAANVAHNVVAVGAKCDLVAVVGDDGAGATMRGMLNAIGAEDANVVTLSRSTTQKTRIVARAQQLVRVDEEEDADVSEEESELLLTRIAEAMLLADAVVLEDYNKGLLTPHLIDRVLRLAAARSLPIVVDPKYRNFFRFGGATVFKPNRRELDAALGSALDADHPGQLSDILERLDVRFLLLTLGERGMLLFSEDGEVIRIPSLARQVYDVVGAGDTVTAYVAVILAAGGTCAEAATIANIAAGIEVGKSGAATVPRAELLAYADSERLLA